jgi:outer membrane protein assembly factor BamB
VAFSKNFTWVTVNRDHGGADLCKRFAVSAYPSLILLGKDDEKIHRFSGFKKPKDFLAQLQDGLRRHALYKEGKEWDTPAERPETICDAATVETFPAPSEEGPSGLAFLSGHLWIVQGGTLFKLDAKNGAVAAKFEISRFVRALCTDGKLLFAMEYGWTAGDPLHVIDPATGKALRQIVTEANKQNRSKGAMGIAWRKGKLYVLAGMRGLLHEIDPRTGEVTRTLKSGKTWLTGLGFNGEHFLAGSRDALHWLDGNTGAAVRSVKLNYPVRVVAPHEGAVYLMEQAIFGHDKQHKRVRVFPKRVLVHKLTFSR